MYTYVYIHIYVYISLSIYVSNSREPFLTNGTASSYIHICWMRAISDERNPQIDVRVHVT